MKALILAALFTLTACNCETVPKKSAEYTEHQKKYLASLDLEGAAYMETCLNGWGEHKSKFVYCINDYRKLGRAPVVQGGPSAGQIATGVAIGTIGAKLLTK